MPNPLNMNGNASGNGDAPSPTLPVTALVAGCGPLTFPLSEGLAEWAHRVLVVPGIDEIIQASQRRSGPIIVILGPALDPQQVEATLPALSERRPAVRVLLLAPSGDVAGMADALERGADDVIPPPHGVDAVLLRAQVLGSRLRQPLKAGAPSTVRVGELLFDRLGRRLRNLRGQEVPLTEREFRLFDRLVQAERGVATHEELFSAAWDGKGEGESVLPTAIHRLRNKLQQLLGDEPFLLTVRGVGYGIRPHLPLGLVDKG